MQQKSRRVGTQQALFSVGPSSRTTTKNKILVYCSKTVAKPSGGATGAELATLYSEAEQ